MKTESRKVGRKQKLKITRNELSEMSTYHQKKEVTSLEIESNWMKARFNKKTEENFINPNQIKNPTWRKSIIKIISNWLKLIPLLNSIIKIIILIKWLQIKNYCGV